MSWLSTIGESVRLVLCVVGEGFVAAEHVVPLSAEEAFCVSFAVSMVTITMI